MLYGKIQKFTFYRTENIRCKLIYNNKYRKSASASNCKCNLNKEFGWNEASSSTTTTNEGIKINVFDPEGDILLKEFSLTEEIKLQ